MAIRALIVDDEPLVRADFRQLLAAHPDVVIEAEAGTLDECEAALARGPFDVVFLDVQLRGCDGFDVVPLIPPTSEIVFVTAFDSYAVRAFEVNALDYLVKPVSPGRLGAALDRLRPRRGGEQPAPLPGTALELTDRVLLKTDSARRFVEVERIRAIASVGGNYTEVFLRDEERRPAVRQTLKEWEAVLPGGAFFRIHRNALVSLAAIERVGPQEVFVAGCPQAFTLSRRCAGDFLEALEAHAARQRRG